MEEDEKPVEESITDTATTAELSTDTEAETNDSKSNGEENNGIPPPVEIFGKTFFTGNLINCLIEYHITVCW